MTKIFSNNQTQNYHRINKKMIKQTNFFHLKLFIIIGIIFTGFSLKVQRHMSEHYYIWVSEDKSEWIGYLPQCEYICIHKEEG